MAGEETPGRGPGRRDEILETFTRHVAERGYNEANFSAVAAELGMSKGTIVHHYGTKDRLLAELHESYMRRRLHEAQLIVQRLKTPEEQLAGLLFSFVLYQMHDRSATVAFQREISRIAGTEGSRLRQEHLDVLRDVIRRGVGAGRFRDGDVAVRSLLIFGSAHWMWTWFRPDGKRPAEEIGAELVDMVLGGLLVRRTRLAELASLDGPVLRVVRGCLDPTAAEVRAS